MAKFVLFPPRDYSFDPNKDLQEVEQFGFVNLREAFVNGIVPSLVPETDEKFNGVMNPGTLLPRCQDVFDGVRKAEYVKSKLSELSQCEAERVQRQVETVETVTREVSPE